MEELKDDSTKRIFRGWIEDWEEEAIGDDDPVSEVRILAKYKNLSFYDLDSDSTFTIDPDRLQWNRSNKKEGIERGWSLLGVNENGVEEPFTIPFFIEQFLEQEPPDDIEIIRNEGDEAE